MQTQGLPYVTLVHLLCQRHRQLTTHASKMCRTNRAEHTKRLYVHCVDGPDVRRQERCVEPHTRRGVHPSPICRRQVACARPCLVSERLQARVKICLFIENPSPMSKDPDQLPRDRTPCDYSDTATATDNFLQFPAMTRVLNFTLAFYASLLNPLFTRAA